MGKKAFIIILVIGLVAVVATVHFQFDWFKSFNINTINAVPNSAAFIVECKNTQDTWKKLKSTKLWKDLIEQQYLSKLNKNYEALDSIIIHNTEINELVNSQEIVVSAHPVKMDDYDFLYVIKLPRYKGESYVNNIIEDLLKNEFNVNNRRYENINLYELNLRLFTSDNTSFTYSVVQGLFIGSFSSLLVEESLRQINKKQNFNQDQIFTKVRNVAGAKVDANIYVNFKMLPGLLTTYVSAQNYKAFKFMKYFAQWAEMDLKIKEDAIMLNGFTASEDSLPTYLNIFLKQKPQNIEVANYIPNQAATLMYFGMSDFKSFYNDYSGYVKNYDYLDLLTNAHNKLKDDYNLSIENDFLNWIGNEYAFVMIEKSSVSLEVSPAAYIHSSNIKIAENTLNQLISKVNNKLQNEQNNLNQITLPKDENYHGYTIKYLAIPNLLSLLFGDLFRLIETPYFTTIGNYIVFANDLKTMQTIIEKKEQGLVLSKDSRYLKFTESLSDKANFFLYINSSKVINLIKDFASDDFKSKIEENLPYFKKFSQIGIQMNSSGDMFYSNIYLQYEKSIKENTHLVWKKQLDAPAMTQPQIVINHNTNEKEIMIQDSSFRLYLIDNAGEIIWKIQLDEPIISEVQQVDFFKNNKYQYLFNTPGFIHLIDRNGRKVENYPVALKNKATNGLSVFDYEKDLNYRIFIACDNQVYGYRIDGKIIPEWGPRNVKGTVKKPILHLTIKDKDFLIFLTQTGNLNILDRKGNVRVKVQENIAHVSDNPIFIQNTGDISTATIAFTDTSGNIISTDFTGKISVTNKSDFSSKHIFYYTDLNNDTYFESMFVDNNKLRMFARDSAELFTYWFNNNITLPIQHFNFGSSSKIAVTSHLSNEIFLFNSDGTVFNGFPLAGNTSICIDDFLKNGSYKLITGSSDKFIYVYSLD